MFYYDMIGTFLSFLLLIIMVRQHSLLLTLALSIVSIIANSQNYYCTYVNNFEGFGNCEIADERLSTTNATDTTRILLHQSEISDYKYRIVARMANRNNKENKAYSVKGVSGDIVKINNPIWGLVFNYASAKDFYAIELQCANTSPYDNMFDKRVMKCDAVHYINGDRHIVASNTLQNGVDPHSGDNLIAIEYNKENVTVKMGEKSMADVLSFHMNSRGKSKTGVLSGPGADVSVERFIIKQEDNPINNVRTNWTNDSIAHHISHSSDVIEGYWQYLDRDIDEKKLKLGGRYTVALIRSADGYDIIYISGAEVSGNMWKPGYLKGRLKNTPFQDHYDMIWYDATFKPFTIDVYATIENGSILTLSFPIQKSSIRFYKK